MIRWLQNDDLEPTQAIKAVSYLNVCKRIFKGFELVKKINKIKHMTMDGKLLVICVDNAKKAIFWKQKDHTA